MSMDANLVSLKDAGVCWCRIEKNGVIYLYSYNNNGVLGNGGNSFSCDIDMAQNDYVDYHIYHNHGAVRTMTFGKIFIHRIA